MTRTILHAVVCGIILGVMAFFVPKLLLGLLFLGFILRAFHCCGRSYRCCGHRHERLFYMADRIRKMNEEEYLEFKTKMGGRCCNNGNYHHNHCCEGSKTENMECCKSAKEEKTSN
jgi:hypothetical protein